MLEFVANHWSEILFIHAPQVIAAASALLWTIARLTPNKWDDRAAGYLDKGLKLLKALSLHVEK